MNEIKVYKLNQTYFTLETPNEECDKELYSYFSCVIPEMRFSKAYKNKNWNGKISFYEAKNGLLPIGLFPNLRQFSKSYSYTLNLLFDKSEFTGSFDEQFLDAFLVDIFKNHKKPDFKLRYYQKDSIQAILKRKRGVIKAGTSAGKSAIIYSVTRYFHSLNKRTLIIVPNQGLVEQFYTDFKNDIGWEEVDENCSRMYSGKLPNLRHNILISTYQTLAKQENNFFESFDCVLVDEAQTAQSKSIADKILRKCSQTEYRIGFTGTLPRGKYESMRIQAYLGDVIYSISTEELQKGGFVNKCKVASLILKYGKDDVSALWSQATVTEFGMLLEYQDEVRFINSHPKRNNSLKYVFSKVKDKQNSLLLVNEIAHLGEVEKYVSENLPKYKIYVITGEVDVDEREAIRQVMESEGNVILLATYGTMSAGVSITNLEHVILFRSFRSEIRVLQSIGRGLRLREGKATTIIWDIVDYLPLDEVEDGGNEKTHYNHSFNQWNVYDKTKTFGKDLGEIKFGRMDYYKEQKFETVQIIKNLDEFENS